MRRACRECRWRGSARPTGGCVRTRSCGRVCRAPTHLTLRGPPQTLIVDTVAPPAFQPQDTTTLGCSSYAEKNGGGIAGAGVDRRPSIGGARPHRSWGQKMHEDRLDPRRRPRHRRLHRVADQCGGAASGRKLGTPTNGRYPNINARPTRLTTVRMGLRTFVSGPRPIRIHSRSSPITSCWDG